MKLRKAALLLVITSASLCDSQCQKRKQSSGNLPQVLLQIDQSFHVSVLAELVDPVPSNLSIRLGPESTAREALEKIVERCPGYVLIDRKEAFIVAQKQLFTDLANPMNQVLAYYQIPGNLAEFKLSFPNAVGASQQGVTGVGGFFNGLSLPEELSPPLKIESLHNVTARDILLRVAVQVRNLYSILILPSAHPEKQEHDNAAFLAWEIAAGPGIAEYRSYLSTYPQK